MGRLFQPADVPNCRCKWFLPLLVPYVKAGVNLGNNCYAALLEDIKPFWLSLQPNEKIEHFHFTIGQLTADSLILGR